LALPCFSAATAATVTTFQRGRPVQGDRTGRFDGPHRSTDSDPEEEHKTDRTSIATVGWSGRRRRGRRKALNVQHVLYHVIYTLAFILLYCLSQYIVSGHAKSCKETCGLDNAVSQVFLCPHGAGVADCEAVRIRPRGHMLSSLYGERVALPVLP